ncbi:MAG: rhamnulokinase [Sedimentisphaerales bacterium]|nr:rhamnulokinase [Sedimentisphaerales bacterium]
MKARSYVAIDLGAESGRVMLACFENEQITLQEAHRFPNKVIEQGDSLHWNFAYLLDQIKLGIRQAVSMGDNIRSMGIDTWGVDFGLLDANGTLLENPRHYRDVRNAAMMEKACEILSRETIYNHTGTQFLPFNTLYQLLAYQRHQLDVLARAQTLLFMPNLLMHHLTGSISAEYTIASTSQMLNMHTGTWSETLLNTFNLPAGIMPTIAMPGTSAGKLKNDIAQECGCPQLAMVAVGCHDTASAVAGVPVEIQKRNWAYLSSGTWSLMGVELEKPLINTQSFKYDFTNEGGVEGTIRLLKNIMGLWPVQQCRQQWLSEGCELDYATLTDMAAQAQPYRAYVDVDQSVFMAKGQMPEKINHYLHTTGQGKIEDQGQLIRIILESLAVKYGQTLARIEKLTDQSIDIVHVVGGGCQNHLLNQFTADATGKRIIAGPVEATVLGNVLVQAVTDGLFKNIAEGRACIARSFPTQTFAPTRTEQWDRFRRTFSVVY